MDIRDVESIDTSHGFRFLGVNEERLVGVPVEDMIKTTDAYSSIRNDVKVIKGDLDNIDNYLGSYGNIAKPTDQVLNSVWSSATGTYDSDGWSRISVDVQENTFYTCGYISADFSWFVDANGNSLGRITTNSFITPTGCKKINISEHATTPFVVVNKKLDLIPTIEDFPYGKLYFELESKIDEIEKKTDEVVVIKNIANPSNVYANSYWSGANTKASANDYYCIKIEVEPNKHYTINGRNDAFSFYGDANENSLGKIAENRYIYTPNNCKYLYITLYKASEFICINALYEGSLKYSEMPYGELINIVIDKLSLTNNFKSLNVPYYKTTTIYVSDRGSDTDGNGTSENPYATIYKANSVIKDANEYNRYIVKVADGNYTDLQTRYSGISKIDGQNYLGVICKSYVSYVGNVEHPENCVIEWDGSTGLESKISEGNLIYDDLVRKCPFHIVHAYETHVQGFRIIGKNLRYAMHIESEGFGKDTKFTIKNMIFEWNGCPDCNDYKNPAAIGIGSSGWEVGEFDNIKVIFGDEVTSKWSFQTHDNFNQSGNPVAVGCKYTVKNVDFGGGGIQLRTLRSQMSDNKYTCSFENCYGISNIINVKAEEATKVNWAYELRFTEIDS